MKRTLLSVLIGCLVASAALRAISIEETGQGDPIVFLPGGLRVRSRRFERETRPLIERLDAFEERFPTL